MESDGECLKGEKMNRLKNISDFIKEEDGMGTVEVILIIVVLIGLVILFKSQITTLVRTILNKITSQANSI